MLNAGTQGSAPTAKTASTTAPQLPGQRQIKTNGQQSHSRGSRQQTSEPEGQTKAGAALFHPDLRPSRRRSDPKYTDGAGRQGSPAYPPRSKTEAHNRVGGRLQPPKEGDFSQLSSCTFYCAFPLWPRIPAPLKRNHLNPVRPAFCGRAAAYY